MVYLNTMSWEELVEQMLEQLKQTENKGLREWLLTKKDINKRLFDANMYRYAYEIQKKLTTDRDHVTVIVGKEGIGKSTLGANLCGTVSPSFEKKNMCYEPEDFIQQLRQKPIPGTSLQMDEGALFLFSRDAMGSDSRTIIRLLTIIRQLNLHIVICIPNFWILDSYVRNHRVDAIFYVNERGHYVGIVGDGVKLVSNYGKEHQNISYVLNRIAERYKWRGNFTKDILTINDLNDESYRALKLATMNRHLDKIDGEYKDVEEQSDYIKVATFAKLMEVYPDTVTRWLRDGTVEGKKIMQKWYVHKKYLHTPSGTVLSGSAGRKVNNKTFKAIRENNRTEDFNH